MPAERLQKVLARSGVGSRRQIEELIRQGRITVNGETAELGRKVDLSEDAVKIDGRRILAPKNPQHYILLNKPVGYVSTRNDPEGRPTVLDLLPVRFRTRVVPVGRLDFDSEGLMLLTDDGDLAQRVSHPSFGCTKTYAVKVKGMPAPPQIERLRRGMRLDEHVTAPAKVTPRQAPSGKRQIKDNSWWTVVLTEGRTRQIREMFFRIGHPVARLKRVAVGSVRDPRLPRGQWRELTAAEVESLRRKTANKSPRQDAPRQERESSRPAQTTTRSAKAKARPSGTRGPTKGPASRGRSNGPKTRTGKPGSRRGPRDR